MANACCGSPLGCGPTCLGQEGTGWVLDRDGVGDRTTRNGDIVAVWGAERGESPFAVRFGDRRVRLVAPDASAVFEHRGMSELEG